MNRCLTPRGGDILGFNMANRILELNDLSLAINAKMTLT